jgi:hypothetical protein
MSTAPVLPAPYDSTPSPHVLRPQSATQNLVRREVRALLAESAAFRQLPPADRMSLEHHLSKVAGYAAECIRDDWASSQRLGQVPVAVERPARTAAGGRALAAADDFAPAAANQIGRVTEATLRALSFPDFVADLIQGSFTAIVNSSIQQMEAYTRLLEDVAKTVDQFMADYITDNQARDWLVATYPAQIRLADGEPRLESTEGAEDAPPPNWRESLLLPDDVSPGDGDAYEEVLVPAARRKLAQNRLQTLSTLVLMGINRIIVTGGKIRATMAFHVDTTDRAAQQHASDFDFRTGASGSVGFGPWSASASVSVGYVTSNRSQSLSELNVAADLTGEVEIHFKSDVIPAERFIDGGKVDTIRGNTAIPAANEPTWGDSVTTRAPITPRVAPPPITPSFAPAAPPLPAPPTTPPATPSAAPATPPAPAPAPAPAAAPVPAPAAAPAPAPETTTAPAPAAAAPAPAPATPSQTAVAEGAAA